MVIKERINLFEELLKNGCPTKDEDRAVIFTAIKEHIVYMCNHNMLKSYVYAIDANKKTSSSINSLEKCIEKNKYLGNYLINKAIFNTSKKALTPALVSNNNIESIKVGRYKFREDKKELIKIDLLLDLDIYMKEFTGKRVRKDTCTNVLKEIILNGFNVLFAPIIPEDSVQSNLKRLSGGKKFSVLYIIETILETKLSWLYVDVLISILGDKQKRDSFQALINAIKILKRRV